MADTSNADQRAYWNGPVAESWAALQARMDAQLEPLGRAALDVLAPRPGERLLDVGCGAGATTMALAQAVGRGGRVVGVDVSQPLLALARRRTPAPGAAPVDFVEADAQTHAFEAAAFDGAVSRFGVMFFADPRAAFANLRRALTPGGRLAFVCWRPAAENPMFTAPMEAAGARLPPAPPQAADPDAPGPFAFADPARVRALLADAGFGHAAVEPHDHAVSAGDLDAAVEVGLAVGPLAARLREHPEAREGAADDLRAAFAARLRDGRVEFPAAVWVVSARA